MIPAMPVDSQAPTVAQESPGQPTAATHKQAAVIKISSEEGQAPTLHTFCLDHQGNILAGVSTDQGQIQKLDPDGNLLTTWTLTVRPEAIAVGPNGGIYAAGNGKLLKLDPETGSVVQEADAPNAADALANADQVREQMRKQLEQQRASQARFVEQYEQQIEKLTADGEEDLTAGQKRTLEALRNVVKQIRQPQADDVDDAQLNSMIQAKLAASSLSVAGQDVFLATRALEGYGFDVWRTDDRFENAKKIVTGLRGCCGQMDVQANENGVYVAENARHRVCLYDREGEMLREWGSRARTGIEGFGGCCNPMNVAFGANNDVYTAESTTGRVKRHSPAGELLGLVGSVEIVPGCKKVSIAVSPDGSRVYMLDITRTHIVMMKTTAEGVQVASAD
jgi:sugar lactone lactonase YvrE